MAIEIGYSTSTHEIEEVYGPGAGGYYDVRFNGGVSAPISTEKLRGFAPRPGDQITVSMRVSHCRAASLTFVIREKE